MLEHPFAGENLNAPLTEVLLATYLHFVPSVFGIIHFRRAHVPFKILLLKSLRSLTVRHTIFFQGVVPRVSQLMHYCSYIAAPEGRADFSPWGIPYTDPISIGYIPWRSKSFWLHQIWEFRSPQAVDLGPFCSPSPEFPWQIKGCLQSLLNQTASNP